MELGPQVDKFAGLGDIIIPGMCINFARIFDQASSNRYSIYYAFNVIGNKKLLRSFWLKFLEVAISKDFLRNRRY